MKLTWRAFPRCKPKLVTGDDWRVALIFVHDNVVCGGHYVLGRSLPSYFTCRLHAFVAEESVTHWMPMPKPPKMKRRKT